MILPNDMMSSTIRVCEYNVLNSGTIIIKHNFHFAESFSKAKLHVPWQRIQFEAQPALQMNLIGLSGSLFGLFSSFWTVAQGQLTVSKRDPKIVLPLLFSCLPNTL